MGDKTVWTLQKDAFCDIFVSHILLPVSYTHLDVYKRQDVEYTRTTDIYQTPFEKATLGNQSGADFFISFHRNSSPEPNQYSGVETLVYDKSGEKLDMAENINGALGELGFQEIGVTARPGLVVLRRTKMPACLLYTSVLTELIPPQIPSLTFHLPCNICPRLLFFLHHQLRLHFSWSVSYTHLDVYKRQASEGISHLFLFTKPLYLQMFSDMGFYSIMQTEDMLLMENRKDGIREYLRQEAALTPCLLYTSRCV